MPQQNAARAKHAREFRNHPDVVIWIVEESERGEEIDDRIEPAFPPRWKPAHVSTRVSEICGSSSFARDPEEVFRVVESVYSVTGLSQKMRVSPLSTWHVENARTNRETDYIDYTRRFVAITLE